MVLHFPGTGGTSIMQFVGRHPSIWRQPALNPPWVEPNFNVGCGASARLPWLLGHVHEPSASSRETLISRGLGGTLHTQDHRCPCEELRTIAAATHATLWGHENVVVAPLRCPRTRYWVVMRDPIKRIFSRILDRYFLEHKEGITREMARAALNSTTTFPGREHLKEFTGSAALNNYYVRSLAGPAVYALPLGGVKAEHLEVATVALHAIDVVLPMDNMSALPTLLAPLYGPRLCFEKLGGKHGHDPTAELRAAESDALLMAAFRHHNALDHQLVLRAHGLFENALRRSRIWCKQRRAPQRMTSGDLFTRGATSAEMVQLLQKRGVQLLQ